MKKWNCDSCGTEIKVLDDYKPEFCCDGRECGCYGGPMNPMFCDDCERIIWGKPVEQPEKDAKIKWLKETGYGDMDDYGAFTLIVAIDDYRAMNRFMFTEVREKPLEILQEIHADFIERAERKEIF